jgi:hypothetical protein
LSQRIAFQSSLLSSTFYRLQISSSSVTTFAALLYNTLHLNQPLHHHYDIYNGRPWRIQLRRCHLPTHHLPPKTHLISYHLRHTNSQEASYNKQPLQHPSSCPTWVEEATTKLQRLLPQTATTISTSTRHQTINQQCLQQITTTGPGQHQEHSASNASSDGDHHDYLNAMSLRPSSSLVFVGFGLRSLSSPVLQR